MGSPPQRPSTDLRPHGLALAPAAAAAHGGRLPPPSSSPPPPPPPRPTLEAALGAQMLPSHFKYCAITLTVHFLALASRPASLLERVFLRLGGVLAGGGLAAVALVPRTYARPSIRVPYCALFHIWMVMLWPHAVDLLRIMTLHSKRSVAAAAAGGAWARTHSAAHLLRAALLLFVAVGWLQACIAAATGAPLPPLVHLPVLAASVAGLCWRATTVCPAFVAEDPANTQLIKALHWVLRQVASFLLPGTRPTLLGAAQALDAGGLCVDVVWALEFSLGFVAPTLILWRAQVSAARRHAARQPLPDDATVALAGSVYERLCARVLHQVDDFGGAAVAAPLAALAGYVASLLVREALRAD